MIARGSLSYTLNEVREYYSDFEIAHKYLGINTLPEIINSPLRKDNNPSLSIYEHTKTKEIIYKDFGTGETGSLYELLASIWNISKQEVYKKILDDSPDKVSLQKNHKNHILRKSFKKIEVKVRQWKKYDLEFWASYGISLETLKFGDVYPISHIFITDDNGTKVFPAEKYAYVYIERKDGILTLKIYQPYSNYFKWISKHDSSVWDLWAKLPEKGEVLIITSSRKDALCIWENTKIPSLSLQGEGYIPKEQVIDELKSRFKKIFVLYDNDFNKDINYGRHFGKSICDKYQLKQIEIPDKYKSKDPSDLYKNYNKETLVKVIKELINN